MSIDCITFDLDDTLWPCLPVLERAEARFLAWLHEHMPEVAAGQTGATLLASRREFAARNPRLAHDVSAVRRAWLAEVSAPFGYGPAEVEAGFRVFWEARNEVTLYEGAADLLAGLRRRLTVGAVTNGNADIEHIGIGHLFDFVVTAADAGAAKPHEAIFRAALASAGARPARAAHVGDDPARDVLGAAAIGMRTVWVNPTLAPWPGGRNPDAVVRGVGEVAAVVEGWLG